VHGISVAVRDEHRGKARAAAGSTRTAPPRFCRSAGSGWKRRAGHEVLALAGPGRTPAACASPRCCRPPPRSSACSAPATAWSASRTSATSHPGVAKLPKLTRARAALPDSHAGIAAGSSADIDGAVRALLRDAIAIYELDLERLVALAPDLIVTQDLCAVCAVGEADVRAALRAIARRDVELVTLHPTRLTDVWDDVRRIGAALGEPTRAAAAAAELEARTAAIAARAAEAASRPSVLSIEWLDPVMVGGTWMPDLIALAGGTPLVTAPGQHAPTLTREQLAALDPDVVLVKPCGFGLERTATEAHLLRENLPWHEWRAAREGRVFFADGNAFFNRSGPRLVESLEILAACVHPERFADLAAAHAQDFRCVDAAGVTGGS
jgi:iron complex transport system substrate-binding protein